MHRIKRFITSKACLRCIGCCRFHEKDSPWSKGLNLIPNPNPSESNFICRFLNPKNNKCKIYPSRPFECRLYPFLINKKGEKYFLAIDLNCPFAKEKFNIEEFKDYTKYLLGVLDKPGTKKILPEIAQGYPDVLNISYLSSVNFQKISIKDKALFNKYLRINSHELSTYAFENIYIWKDLFDICWTIIDNNLCVFFKDKGGIFLYLPPIGKSPKKEIIEEVFNIMGRINNNKEISRIENVEEKNAPWYKGIGYECKEKSCDYICVQADMAQLKGNKFKAKRKSVNYFTKHYKFKYLPFSLKYKNDCMNLYNKWAKERKDKNKDFIYSAMLEDNKKALTVLLKYYKELGVVGRIVKIKNEIKAFAPLEKARHKAPSFLTGFTFAFKLSKDTFCVLYEVADISIKGLSQFIFQRLCGESKDYKYINIMDDSGLENLKKVKLSYHPVRRALSYIIKKI